MANEKEISLAHPEGEAEDLQYKRQSYDGSIIETFDSVSELFRVTNSRTCNSWCYDPSRDQNPSSWSGGKTYDEIKDSVLFGLDVDVNKFKEKIIDADKLFGWDSGLGRKGFTKNINGFIPVVPVFLAGHPKNMLKNKTKPKKGKIINIIYDTSVNASITPDQQATYGAKVVSTVYQLEQQGYRVRLDVLDTFCREDKLYACRVRVKSEDQAVSLKKLAAVLTQVGFQRTVMFDWYERLPDAEYFSGYGRPLMNSYELQRKFKDKFLSSSEYYICFGRDIKEVFKEQLKLDGKEMDDYR